MQKDQGTWGHFNSASSGDERQSSRDGGWGGCLFMFRRALYDMQSCLKFIWLVTLGLF